ncbi:MAG: hypothetical protein HC767_06070 [Akkermansiaceae bacterium]|nr:hypothetical protein [Akkermansiaceae bacterium]
MNLAEEDSGRLEFLGDAVLGLIVTSYIFYCLNADSRKSLRPGQLSDLRSSIVKHRPAVLHAVAALALLLVEFHEI